MLLLGDSISIGYHAAVASALDGEAVVVRPEENCEGTTKGAARINTWLGLEGGNFDVIHFNFGLHDLKRVNAKGKNFFDPSDLPQADLKTYERQLCAIVDAILASGATPVFATTTPVPPGEVRPHRDPADVARYNEVARRIMREHKIAIDDLNRFATPRLSDIQRPVNVHFTPAGSEALGGEVVGSIRRVLGTQVAKERTAADPAGARP